MTALQQLTWLHSGCAGDQDGVPALQRVPPQLKVISHRYVKSKNAVTVQTKRTSSRNVRHLGSSP